MFFFLNNQNKKEKGHMELWMFLYHKFTFKYIHFLVVLFFV